MENPLGLLRVHVQKGINLAIRDITRRSSDPYVIIKMGKQKVKTRVVKKNLNPEWNEKLTLSISDPNIPVKLAVYDKDTFSRDDKMGDAEIDIGPIHEAVNLQLECVPTGTIIKKIQPDGQNCLTQESCIVWSNGKVVQNMIMRLQNVECGELELQLEWINVPSSRGH
ncbi:hypothetical protein SLE2022_274630 [Rubroshorea leprosula]